MFRRSSAESGGSAVRPVLLAAALVLIAVPAARPQEPRDIDPALVDRVVMSTWTKVPDGWASRVEQDETQRLCSLHRNEPPTPVFDAILAREKATVARPTDGKVLGDWKRGDAVAQSGRGGQFSDAAGTVNGGNCYACHQMAPKELSYGTLGPSLVGYGRERKFDAEEARAAYAKIYNSQSVLPCSNMPRFGHKGVLREQQIKDVTAYLFDPDSPVNK